MLRKSLPVVLLAGCLAYRPSETESGGGRLPTDDSTAPPTGDDSTPPVDTSVPPVVDDRVDLGTVARCESPGAGVRWREIGGTMGLVDNPTFDPANAQNGGSLAVDDFDGDGDLDLVYGFDVDTTDTSSVHYLYLQPEGGLDQAWTATELAYFNTGSGYALADIDEDGVRDLISVGPPQILLNKGGGVFEELPFPDLPVGMNDMNLRDLAPADYDNDGDIDLYAGMNGTGATTGGEVALRRDFLVVNDGAGKLLVRADAFPSDAATGKAFDATWFDYDHDGDQDAYIANDIGNITGANQLFVNDGGDFSTAPESCGCAIETTGMGVDAADINGDGFLDLYVTAADQQVLLETVAATNTYVDYSDTVKAFYAEMGWGAVFLDYDNDGDQDILVALGSITHTGEPTQPGEGIGLLASDGGVYHDASVEMGLDQAGGYRTIVVNDLNQDGVLDFIAGDVGYRPQVYVSEGCTANGWLEVEAPIGAWVTLNANGRTYVDQVTTESGRGGATEPFVHFGLGDAQAFSSLSVRLPSGTILEATGGIEARRRIQVLPTESE